MGIGSKSVPKSLHPEIFEEQDQVSGICCGLQRVEAGLRTVGWKTRGLAPIQRQQKSCFNPMNQICPKSQ